MRQKEMSCVYDPSLVSKTANEFLQVIINSKDKTKVLVQFKFKGSNVGCEQWVTRKQFIFLKNMSCIESCKIVGYYFKNDYK